MPFIPSEDTHLSSSAIAASPPKGGITASGTSLPPLFSANSAIPSLKRRHMPRLSHSWQHGTFWVEVAVIAAFAVFWVVQTIELWQATDGLRADPEATAR